MPDRPVSSVIWPHGLDEIKAFYGDPWNFIFKAEDGRLVTPIEWEAQILTDITLPLPLPLSFGGVAQRIACHVRVADSLFRILTAIRRQDLWLELIPFGGCYNVRPKSARVDVLSTHSWGIALDFAVDRNRRGTTGSMHPGIVAEFEAEGWTWGGHWPGQTCDPMHVQACSGY